MWMRNTLMLELKAGTLATRCLRAGDRVFHPAATWPGHPDVACIVPR